MYDAVNIYRDQHRGGDGAADGGVVPDTNADGGRDLDDGGTPRQGRVGGGASHNLQIVSGEIRVGNQTYFVVRRRDSVDQTNNN